MTTVQSATVLWAAGVRDPGMGGILAERTGAERDRSGRVIVAEDLTVPNYPDIFVVGDLAHFAHQDDKPLPGIAPVAMQEGQYVAKLIQNRLKQRPMAKFAYKDTGGLAVIGRHSAVVNFPWMRLTGFPAWFVWLFVHIFFLIEFDNKIIVMIQWASNYITRKQGSRLITLPPDADPQPADP
jgi:NADH dehydrogenase